jgi:hypothetical protein
MLVAPNWRCRVDPLGNLLLESKENEKVAT